MFVQLVLGKVSDAESVRRQWERWMSDLAPGAAGWLGSTGGVTADVRLLMSTCFASAEAAAGNARRPDQVAWWAGIEACLDAPPTIVDTEDVTLIGVGDLRRAGFVQAMRAAIPGCARRSKPWVPRKLGYCRQGSIGAELGVVLAEGLRHLGLTLQPALLEDRGHLGIR